MPAWLLLLWGIGLGALGACDHEDTGSPALNLVSISPAGEVSDDLAAIRVTFDRPVVAAEQVGKPVDPAPLQLEPALPLSAHWVDRQTLVGKPLSPMAPATRYHVRLAPALRGRLRESHDHSFVHRPLRVERVVGLDPRWTPPTPTFTLQLNQPIEAGQAARLCTLARAEDGAPVPLATRDPALVATTVALAPKAALLSGERYTLACEGLVARGGNEPLGAPFRETFRVYPAPAVVSLTPGGGRVTPDELKLTLTLSTPVEYEELARRVVLRPSVEGFAHSWTSRGPGEFEAVVNLKAQTAYRLIVKEGLTDRFGQRLEQAVVKRFETTDAAPGMQLETGIYAIEAEHADGDSDGDGDGAAQGYPVWTRNVTDLALHCAHVPVTRLVDVLTSSLSYEPWYDAGDQAIPWRKLGLDVQKHAVDVSEAKNKWSLRRFDLPRLCGGRGARGVYLAELRSESVRRAKASRGWGTHPHRVLGNVTDLGVLLKAGPASGLVWVTRFSNGEPAAGARVTLYDPSGARVFTGRTDRDGLVRTPGTSKLLSRMRPRSLGSDGEGQGEDEDAWDMYRAQRMIVVVERGDDLAVVDGNWQDGIQAWNFGVPSDRTAGTTRVRGFIQSDRGIYRPGERVHFKGLVREVAIGRPPVVPTGGPISIRIEDSRGAGLLSRAVPLSRFGGFAFELDLDAEAALGDYYVTAELDGQTFRETFQVEEFRPVAFEVRRTDAVAHARAREGLELAFSADYLFGAPVKGAAVGWDVQRRGHTLAFADMPGYTFTDTAGDDDWYAWYDGEGGPLTFVSDGATQTDGAGAFTVAFRDPDPAFDGPQDYLIQARVTDSTHQTVSKRVVVTAHETDVYLGLRTQAWVQTVGTAFSVDAVAVTPEGRRRAVAAELSLSRRTWECTHAGEHRTHTRCERRDQHVFTRPLQIPERGAASEAVTAALPGEYALTVRGRDSAGEAVVASMTVWVTGEGEASWAGDGSTRMSIIADREEYRPGDTARLVPRADVGGARLLVTLERNGVLDAFVTSPGTSGEGLSLPILDVHAPNVFASVAMVRGRTGRGDQHRPEFKLGVVDLHVSSGHKRLEVDVTTEREAYQPGETVRGTLSVRSGGSPVAAELSLSVADEGVLQLIAYQTPDPMQRFYAPWALGIDSATNLNRVARLNDPSEVDTEAGADGGSAGAPRVRSRFVSSALWIPALLTDERGEAEFSFEAPDNLSAFRLMAVAADAGDRFGSGERRIRVAKKLLAKPVLPRFATAGDRLELGAVIHNYSGRDGDAVVTLEAAGMSLAERERRVHVDAGASVPVLFPARAGKAQEATVKLTVALGAHRDAFEVAIPVERPRVTDWTTLAAGESDPAGRTVGAEVTWPEDHLGWLSLVEVSVDRTGLSDLGPSLRYLVRYPYGCLEQTMSGLLPLVKAKDLAESLDLVELQGTRAERYIRLGVAKVLRHQQADGHFSLWPDGETYPHLTAYALWGLGEMERGGTAIQGDVFTRGLAALSSWVGDRARTLEPGGEIGTMAMAAHVLAERGHADPGLNARLLEARAALPLVGKAHLLRAMLRAGADPGEVALVARDLVAAAEGPQMSWPDERDRYMSSPVRDKAIALSALLELGDHDELTRRLVDEIKAARKDSRWMNTQENVYGLIALADYARASGGGTTEVEIALDGEPVAARTIAGSEVLRFWRTTRDLGAGALTVGASTPVHYAIRRKVVRALGVQPAVEAGFRVERRYVDLRTEEPVREVELGQLVKVQLTVTADAKAHYVAVSDPIPAGCEAVNVGLATESDPGGGRPDRSGSPGQPAQRWDHVELRDDRVLAFADLMQAGSARFEYLLRPTIAGEFALPPAHVEAMYAPARMGRTSGETLTVRR